MGTTGQMAHILVINDAKEILDVFKVLLEEEGYRVSLDNFSTMDLGKLMTATKALAPDLVVLDFIVGGEPIGWQLLELLKLDPATARIPLVLCTAAVQRAEELSSHLRTMGVEVVLKPFDLDQILAAIARALLPAGRPDAPGVPPAPSFPA
jgi:two-component system alkaline phosphatase synthesis response regulator PhoP